MRLVDRAVGLERTDCGGDRGTEPVEQFDAFVVEIDQRNVFLRGDGTRLLRVLRQVGMDAAILAKESPGQRSDENRCRAGGARLIDIARHVRAKCREVRLASETLS